MIIKYQIVDSNFGTFFHMIHNFNWRMSEIQNESATLLNSRTLASKSHNISWFFTKKYQLNRNFGLGHIYKYVFWPKQTHFGRTPDNVQTYYCYGGGKNKKATFSLAEFKLYNVPITL